MGRNFGHTNFELEFFPFPPFSHAKAHEAHRQGNGAKLLGRPSGRLGSTTSRLNVKYTPLQPTWPFHILEPDLEEVPVPQGMAKARVAGRLRWHLQMVGTQQQLLPFHQQDDFREPSHY